MDDGAQPIRLKEEDRRRLYGLLGADLPARVRRIEYMLVALLASSGARLLGGLSIEDAPAAIIRFLFG